jgi:hypothetical protein
MVQSCQTDFGSVSSQTLASGIEVPFGHGGQTPERPRDVSIHQDGNVPKALSAESHVSSVASARFEISLGSDGCRSPLSNLCTATSARRYGAVRNINTVILQLLGETSRSCRDYRRMDQAELFDHLFKQSEQTIKQDGVYKC